MLIYADEFGQMPGAFFVSHVFEVFHVDAVGKGIQFFYLGLCFPDSFIQDMTFFFEKGMDIVLGKLAAQKFFDLIEREADILKFLKGFDLCALVAL